MKRLTLLSLHGYVLIIGKLLIELGITRCYTDFNLIRSKKWKKNEMTELSAPSKLAKWKRPLIGGILKGFIAVAITSTSAGDLNIILLGFYFPMFIFQILLAAGGFGDFSETVGLILLPFLFWFLIGAAIVHFSKKIIFAIGWLLLLEIIFTVIIIGYFFLNPVCNMC